MEQNSFYETADFFLVRTALLPLKQQVISQGTLLDFYKNTPLFQEAIAAASLSLHHSLQSYLQGKEEFSNLFPSLLKYFLRMSSRATPFGLFSAVGWGEFSERTDLSFPFSSLDKKIKPDMEWIKAFIDDLHQERRRVRQLKVMTNPNLVKKAGRVFLRTKSEKPGDFDPISIKSTFASDFVFSLSKTPVIYSELEEELISKFDEHPKEKIVEYLWQIFQNGYLLSEYSLALNRPFSLHQFYNEIKKTGGSLAPLENLLSATEKYENAAFGHGLSQLQEVVNDVNQSKDLKYPTQIDAYRKTGTFHLSHSVKERIEEVASLLSLLSTEESSRLSAYQKQFQEKYGTYRLVPALELIDPHRGLGFPQLSFSTQERASPPTWQEMIFSSLKNKTFQIDSLEKSIASHRRIQNTPLSVELYFELLASSQEEINSGNFTLVMNTMGISNQAGSSFGRFLHLCTPPQRDQLRELLQKEEALYPQALFVEASFLPDDPRVANIAIHEPVRRFQLDMHFHELSLQTIELEDIYIGAAADRLYLYSKKWNKELYVTLSNAVSITQAPPVLQFLLQISRSRFTSFSSVWKGADDQVFLPRLCYKNVVLMPARWRFSPSSLKVSENPSSPEVEKALEDALVSFEVPPRVYLSHFDNRILVNWKNKEEFQLIVQQFINRKEVLLFELVGEVEDRPVHSENGRHVAEFVVPCIKKTIYKIDEPLPDYPPCDQIALLDRLYPPGGEWLFIKLFLSKEDEEFFLRKEIHPMIHSFLENQSITQWFYIRYREDRRSHVRLRLRGHYHQFMPALYERTSLWLADGVLSDVSFHVYEREIERYGGPDSIESAEEIFCADSEWCLELLEKVQVLDLPPHVGAAFGIINLVRSFYPSPQGQLEFLSPHLKNKNLLSGIRKYTPTAVQLVLDFFYNEAPSDPFVQSMRAHLCTTGEAAKKLCRIISDNAWNTKASIVQSLLHMHCNRFLGADPEAESKALVTAHHLLEKASYRSIKKKEVLCSF